MNLLTGDRMAVRNQPRVPLLNLYQPSVVFSAPMFLALATLLVFLGLMIVLAVILPTDPKQVSVFPISYYIGTLSNFVFLTCVPLLVAYYAGRIYLVSSIKAFLYLCSGVIVLSFSAPIAAFMAETGKPNAGITIYNISMLCSSVLHFIGCLTLYSAGDFSGRKRKTADLVFTLLASSAFVIILTLLARQDILPLFFVPGHGTTQLRNIVLDFSVFFFLISSVLTFLHYRATGEQSFFWYALGVASLATGILGVSYLRAPFDLINWAGRITQMLGGLYFLSAVFLAFKPLRQSHGGIDQAVREFYRSVGIHFHDLVETASDAIVSFVDDRIAIWNPAAERLFGFSRKEAAGLSLDDIFKDQNHLFSRPSEKLGEPLIDRRTEARATKRSGEVFPVEVSVSERELAGQTARTFVIRDVTERKRAEEALRERERHLRGIFESTEEAIITLDEEQRCLETNPAAGVITGIPQDQLIGGFLKELADPDFDLSTAWEGFLKSGRFRGEIRIRHSSGTYRTIDASGVAHISPGRHLFVGHDITERKKVEKALRQSDFRFRLALRNAPVSVAVQDRDLQYIWAYNQRTASPEEIIGKRDEDIFTSEEAARIRVLKQRVLDENIELREQMWFDRPSGRIFLDVYWEPVHDKEGNVIGVGSATVNLTSLKLAEEALRASEAKFRIIFETNVVAIAYCHIDGRILDANDRYLQITGYSKDELAAGEARWDVITPPEWKHMDDEGLRKLTEEGVCPPMEKEYLRRDGTRVPVLLGTCQVPGNPEQVIAFAVDLTERKRIEEELRQSRDKFEERVRERTAELERRNEELQNFTFAASHDLQEPLRKLQTFSDLLAIKCSGEIGDQGRDYLRRMHETATRMRDVLQSLLKYSRLTAKPEPFERVDLNEIAGEVISDLNIRISETGASVEIGDLPEIEADPAQMRQLLQNLLENALKFGSEGKQPKVRIHSDCDGTPQNGQCELYVEDNGIGFEEKYMDRIFKPFQRLHGKNEYGGVGMGLAICAKVVEHHNGKITAKSTPGQGSTFIVTLPVNRSREGQ